MSNSLIELKKYVELQHKNSMKLAEVFDKFCISDEAKTTYQVLYDEAHMLSNIYENAVILEKMFYSSIKILLEEK